MERYTRVKVSDITSPLGKDVVQVLEDRYWVVTQEDEVLLYRGYSPQCNRNKKIVEKQMRMHEGCTIKHLPVAFVPWSDHWHLCI